MSSNPAPNELALTMTDYRIIEGLHAGIHIALSEGDYVIARRYIRTAVTLLNPTVLKTPTDLHKPYFNSDRIQTAQDEVWTILDAIATRPSLARHLEVSLMRLRGELFDIFMKGATTDVD